MSLPPLEVGDSVGGVTVAARGRRGYWYLRHDTCGHESWHGFAAGIAVLRDAARDRARPCKHPSHRAPQDAILWARPQRAEPQEVAGAALARRSMDLWALERGRPAGGPALDDPALCEDDHGPTGGSYLLDPCAEGDELDAAHDEADALARSADPAERAEGARRQAILSGIENERAAAILRRERGLAPDAELPPGLLDAARRRTT